MKDPQCKSMRRCAHCGHAFSVNPRLGRRHRYCAKPECQGVRRNANRRRWLKRNGGRGYYTGPANTERVRRWRDAHPAYWRRETRLRQPKLGAALSKRFAAVLKLVALQDSIDSPLALKIGIISEMTGATLQDSIAREMRRLMLRGHAILRGRRLPA